MVIECGDIEYIFSQHIARLDNLIDSRDDSNKLYSIKRSLAHNIQDELESQYMNVWDELELHERRTVIG